ncbi:MAG: hypothetical protein M1828_000113 [Chrysothrix sp. TS-e1954]|nr:MAG: hypothetical protein M1828_000113 [Chrysothrix sp. TS-e1954]
MTNKKTSSHSSQHRGKCNRVFRSDYFDGKDKVRAASASTSKCSSTAPKPKKVKVSSFHTQAFLLEIPVELRMDIYDYVWQGAFLAMSEMSLLKPSESERSCLSSEVTHFSGIKVESDFHLTKGKQISSVRSPFWNRTFTDFYWRHQRPSNTALTLTCKKLSSEFSEHVHSTSTFAFGSSKKIESFLSRGVRSKQEIFRACYGQTLSSWGNQSSFIRSIYVELPCYNDPFDSFNQVYASRFYQSWTKACERLATETNLQDVTVSIKIPDNKPCCLSLRESWVQPLLQFTKAEIRSASVKLISPMNELVSWRSLEAFGEVLRRKLLRLDDLTALHAINEYKQDFPIDESKADLSETYKALDKWNGLYDYSDDMKTAEAERLARKAAAQTRSEVASIMAAARSSPKKGSSAKEAKPTQNKRKQHQKQQRAEQKDASHQKGSPPASQETSPLKQMESLQPSSKQMPLAGTSLSAVCCSSSRMHPGQPMHEHRIDATRRVYSSGPGQAPSSKQQDLRGASRVVHSSCPDPGRCCPLQADVGATSGLLPARAHTDSHQAHETRLSFVPPSKRNRVGRDEVKARGGSDEWESILIG